MASLSNRFISEQDNDAGSTIEADRHYDHFIGAGDATELSGMDNMMMLNQPGAVTEYESNVLMLTNGSSVLQTTNGMNYDEVSEPNLPDVSINYNTNTSVPYVIDEDIVRQQQ